MPRSPARIAILANTLWLLAACSEGNITGLSRYPLKSMDCPSDVGTGPLFAGKYADSTKSVYVTILIDGRIAKWNFNATKGGPLNIAGIPTQAEVANIHIASHRLSYRAIGEKYGTCPGVQVELWETKRGDWRPSASPVGY